MGKMTDEMQRLADGVRFSREERTRRLKSIRRSVEKFRSDFDRELRRAAKQRARLTRDCLSRTRSSVNGIRTAVREFRRECERATDALRQDLAGASRAWSGSGSSGKPASRSSRKAGRSQETRTGKQ